jgi:hypothetical protein
MGSRRPFGDFWAAPKVTQPVKSVDPQNRHSSFNPGIKKGLSPTNFQVRSATAPYVYFNHSNGKPPNVPAGPPGTPVPAGNRPPSSADNECENGNPAAD